MKEREKKEKKLLIYCLVTKFIVLNHLVFLAEKGPSSSYQNEKLRTKSEKGGH